MPLKYSYHPGNVAHSSATEVNQTMVPLARSLGIELLPMEGATSCGAGIIRQANDILQITLNARNFAIAESLGADIITPCAATAGNLYEDLSRLKEEPLLMRKTQEVLLRTTGMKFHGGIKVNHLLHVLVDEIGLDKVSQKVRNPINLFICIDEFVLKVSNSNVPRWNRSIYKRRIRSITIRITMLNYLLS